MARGNVSENGPKKNDRMVEATERRNLCCFMTCFLGFELCGYKKKKGLSGLDSTSRLMMNGWGR